jgi:hypothetical protein
MPFDKLTGLFIMPDETIQAQKMITLTEYDRLIKLIDDLMKENRDLVAHVKVIRAAVGKE